MSIFEVRHQPRAQKIVQRALASGRLPHAYVFYGPDGVGKKMLAERLARVLLCEQPRRLTAPPIAELAGFEGPLRDACGACQDCTLVRSGTHPDLHLIYRELHHHHPDAAVRGRKGLELSVDVVRHFLIEAVGTKPARGRGKVFVIREADRISSAAQNALLKTLEEPPATTFLVLLAAGLDKLLPTTRSRCQPVPFGPLPAEFVASQLPALVPGISCELAGLYAAWAQGSLGVARRYAEDDLASYNQKMLESLSRLGTVPVTQTAGRWLEDAKALAAQAHARDKEISETEAQRRGLKALFSLVAAWFGERLHLSIQAGEVRGDTVHPLPLDAAGISPQQAARAIQAVVDAERHLDRSAAAQLVVETLVTRLTRIASATTAAS